MVQDSGITFLTSQSPNGHKIGITLEELGLTYKIRAVSLPNLEHKEPWFLELNPNGRIPALTDTLPDGTPIALWESGSIQQYLVDRYDTDHKISYPRGTKEWYLTNSWLFFQNASIGPMQGQVFHFVRYSHATTPQDYAIDRYVNETRRLYRVIDKHLADTKSTFLVGDKMTIADIAIASWASAASFADLDLSEFPHVIAWHNRILERPAVKRGFDTPSKANIEEILGDPEKYKAYIAMNESWIRKLMIENRKK